MPSLKNILFIAFSLLAFSFTAQAETSKSQAGAKKKGIELYNQFKAISAVPYLKSAAESGDHEAQYYLGEALRKNNKYITPEAQSAYEASALQGDIYAMIRLSQRDNDLCVAMKNCPVEKNHQLSGRKAHWRRQQKKPKKVIVRRCI
ncbi:hypothetical protein [Pseudomonas sp. TH03]|uniref:hypothetical protein n=1 Tax=Pseudomonas sp. TH03 TaxID=2796369 RepID=UPI001F5BC70A|nr:hypothetical protein [Pseudomonas sp. TH03]